MYIVLASSRIYSARRQAITRDDDDDDLGGLLRGLLIGSPGTPVCAVRLFTGMSRITGIDLNTCP